VRGFDPDSGVWTAPFVMAAINTRIVLRSHALGAGAATGAEVAQLLYDEAVMTGRGLRGRLAAVSLSAGLAAFMVASALGPTRWALQRFVLPAPGEGPSPAAQAKGFFDLRFQGTTTRGERLRVKVTGDRDPGYGSTAKMLGEAAACLALELPAAGDGGPAGGFWTPASLLGERLIGRLRANAGLSFDVV
jgi:short subunit dehydrogenase-like uncharacterized protein